MQSCILATDMARHMGDLAELKSLVTEGKPASLIDPDMDADAKFKRQQKFLDMAMHSSDISFLCREVPVFTKWVDLLFEDEFFKQGDIEREQGLKVSFLCDRETTNKSSANAGFVNFAPLPLFKVISVLMPSKQFIEVGLEKAKAHWEEIVAREKAQIES